MAPTTAGVGWVGTGRMGTAMASRLIAAGERVTVWNRTSSKTEPLAARGADVAAEITGLAGCEIVFITVAGPGDLEQVVLGERGLLSAGLLSAGVLPAGPAGSAGLLSADVLPAGPADPAGLAGPAGRADLAGPDGPKPAVIVDCSTVSPEVSARVRAAAAAAGVEFLAAPVSGNPHVVADGGACIVASGPAATFNRVRPYLERIAKIAVHAGEGEQARLVKLCTNLYLGMLVQALVEVTTLAEKGGTDRAAFLAFLNGTVLGSEWTRRRAGDLIDRDWKPTFTTELLRKDFDLGLGSARDLEVPMPVGSVVYQLIQSAINGGLRHADFLSLYDQQARAAGIGEG